MAVLIGLRPAYKGRTRPIFGILDISDIKGDQFGAAGQKVPTRQNKGQVSLVLGRVADGGEYPLHRGFCNWRGLGLSGPGCSGDAPHDALHRVGDGVVMPHFPVSGLNGGKTGPQGGDRPPD